MLCCENGNKIKSMDDAVDAQPLSFQEPNPQLPVKALPERPIFPESLSTREFTADSTQVETHGDIMIMLNEELKKIRISQECIQRQLDVVVDTKISSNLGMVKKKLESAFQESLPKPLSVGGRSSQSTSGVRSSQITSMQEELKDLVVEETLSDDMGITVMAQTSTAKWDDSLSLMQKLGLIVESKYFDYFFGVFIVVNAAFIALEVDFEAKHKYSESPLHGDTFAILQIVFCILFVVELLMRLIFNREHFLKGKEKNWAILDVLMAFFGVLELIIELLPSVDSAVFLRVVKTARLFRIMRIMRFTHALRTMLFTILESMKQLIWLVILLIIVFYIFATIFTMAATDTIDSERNNKDPEIMAQVAGLELKWKTVMNSGYSCFLAMSGGQSWGELLEPLKATGKAYVFAFLCYIVFSVLVLLNIITGVFVDGAMVKSQYDRDLVVEKEMLAKQAFIKCLQEIFSEGDLDGSGLISFAEFKLHLKDDRVRAYLTSLKIDISNIPDLFFDLDKDGSGDISLEEFVENLMAMIGATDNSKQIQTLINEGQRLDAKVDTVIHQTNLKERLKSLRSNQ